MRVKKVVNERLDEMTVEVPLSQGRLLAEVGANCVVLGRETINEHVRMRLRAPKRLIWKLEPYRNS